MVLIFSLIIILLALMGMPLFAVIAAAAMLGFYLADIDLLVVIIELYRLVDTPLLLALPLFAFSGYLLAESQAAHRVVKLTHALLGWLPGGLALMGFLACAFFTAFTGASGVTIVALGALLLPALKEDGYKEDFALGLVTTSGSLGLLIVPSLPLILYGIIVQQMNLEQSLTLNDLFIAGIVPALLMVALLYGWSLWSTREAPIPLNAFDRHEAWAAVKEARWELPLPLLVLGGIYGGYFAVSEAAAVTTLYLLIVEVFIYREISLKRLPQVMSDAMVMVGSILLILGVSLGFTNFLVDAEVPARVFDYVQQVIDNKYTFLLALNIMLLVLGAILDIFAALVIVVPLIVPVAMQYGIHPVHLGIVFLANMQIGYFTPPVGINLFIASYRFNKPITTLYRASLPFMLVLLVALLLITYIPALSLGLLPE